ncbi:MAG: cyclic nucleotide-binding domain-containing protein [Fibrobacterota bacterium]|nr:cyclic nucleotide-binding domain-containing protein [Chitinispirillaceae bacterium]
MLSFRIKEFYLPAFVLAFVFCGAIVGENVSISLVVSALGSQVLSKLYLVNGILLCGLPILFFRKIDRIDRGKLLSRQLLVISAILLFLLIGMSVVTHYNHPFKNYILLLLYPFSYLTKTILFLTFWTLANDIFPTGEAKKAFPLIAAWGMAGGLAGACIAQVIVNAFTIESVVVLWTVSYLVAWYFAEKIRIRFQDRLRFREDLPVKNSDIISDATDVITLNIVRLIAILYFVVFVGIFSIDFLFWNICHKMFTTSETLVSFQFGFYLFHAIAAIGGLWFALPPLIRKFGFTRLFYCLPVTLLAGALVLFPFVFGGTLRAFFTAFVIIQFLRYVIFENTFSPIYQMFFAAIEMDKRGRAKTMLEGIVKPAAIISSGILLIVLGNNNVLILILLSICSALSIGIIFFLRKTYSRTLIPEVMATMEPTQIIASVSHYESRKLEHLIKEYSHSDEPDMRIFAVRLLANGDSITSLERMIKMFKKESDTRVKEAIARSLHQFFWIQTREFIEQLIEDPNPRIRANALLSLNKMNCGWKRYLKDNVHHLLFDRHLRVQVEAAKFLWNNGDPAEIDSVMIFHKSLTGSQWVDRRAAGVYLAGELKADGWKKYLIDMLATQSQQVFKKTVEVIMQSSLNSLQLESLRKIDLLTNEYVEIAGIIIEKNGHKLWDGLIEFLPECKNRQLVFEIIRCLRMFTDSLRAAGKNNRINDSISSIIYMWVHKELEVIYHECFVRMNIGDNDAGNTLCSMLDTALREKYLRVCQWATNAMVLLDKTGMFVWRHTDIDIKEQQQRFDLVEILESSSNDKIGELILPFLKSESWSTLGKIGKSEYHFENRTGNEHLELFLQSDDNWLILCTMRTMLYYNEVFEKNISKELLVMHRNNSNRHVATAAKDLIEKSTNEDRLRSDAFILLEKVLFFKKTQLFKNVSAEKLMKLAEISQYAVFEKDTTVSVQGEVSEHLYIVKKGSLRVIKSYGDITTEISEIKVGETYGEIGLFTQSPRSASAVTSDSCEVFIIKRGAFKKLLLEVPEIAYNMLETMSERLRKNADDIIELHRRVDD